MTTNSRDLRTTRDTRQEIPGHEELASVCTYISTPLPWLRLRTPPQAITYNAILSNRLPMPNSSHSSWADQEGVLRKFDAAIDIYGGVVKFSDNTICRKLRQSGNKAG